MSSLRVLKTLVTERLTAAVEEILDLVGRVMAEQEAELVRRYGPCPGRETPQSRGDARGDVQWLDGSRLQHQVKEEPPELPIIKQEQEKLEEVWSAPPVQDEAPQMKTDQDSELLIHAVEDVQWLDGSRLQHQVKEEPPELPIIKQEQEKLEQVWSAPPVQDEAPQMETDQDSELLIHGVEGQISSAPCGEDLKVELKDEDVLPSTSSELTDAAASDPDHPPDADSSGLSCCCKVCGMVFSYRSLSSLMNHAEIHADDQRAVCGVCGRLLPDRDRLLEHLQTHIKIHVCHVCRKTFQQHCELVEHLQYHSSNTPFPCTVCGKKFETTTGLIRHSMSHKYRTKHHTDGEPNYCSQCNRCFSDKYTLRKHMKKKTKCFPFLSNNT